MNAQFWIHLTEYSAPLLGFFALIALIAFVAELVFSSDSHRPIRVGVALIAPILTVILAVGALFCGAYAVSHKPTTCEKESK